MDGNHKTYLKKKEHDPDDTGLIKKAYFPESHLYNAYINGSDDKEEVSLIS